VNDIEAKQLRKSYGSREVLHGIDLSVPRGRLIGFLGPNGAGKTTTIRILVGLIKATAGDANVLGQSCWRDGTQVRKHVGYLPGEVHLYPHLTGASTLRFLAHARRVDCRQEIDRLANRFELDLQKTVRSYSSGMKQKLGLIQALMHRPQVLILDEPTNGLDPLVRKSLFRELRSIVEDCRTVLFSSHTLGEVEELCDEVIILRDGHVIEQQSISALRGRALRRVQIVFSNPADMLTEPPPALTVIEREGATVTCAWRGDANQLISWLHQQSLKDVTIQAPGLEDLFLAYYAGDRQGSSL
jgi:ABC-2 type transport system ATP-binding protein